MFSYPRVIYSICVLLLSSKLTTSSITKLSLSLIPAISGEPSVKTSIHASDTEERTFVAIKPDAVQRNLIGEIIKRVEGKGLKVVALKLIRPSTDVVMEHYGEHKDQYFYQDLTGFFLSGPIVALVLEGCDAIRIVRKLVGKTQPEDAEPGTIRGDYCLGKGRNLVHASDSAESAAREIGLWFAPSEIIEYSKTIDQWVKLQTPPEV
jgi:nucleoside-diphosphate kinase